MRLGVVSLARGEEGSQRPWAAGLGRMRAPPLQWTPSHAVCQHSQKVTWGQTRLGTLLLTAVCRQSSVQTGRPRHDTCLLLLSVPLLRDAGTPGHSATRAALQGMRTQEPVCWPPARGLPGLPGGHAGGSACRLCTTLSPAGTAQLASLVPLDPTPAAPEVRSRGSRPALGPRPCCSSTPHPATSVLLPYRPSCPERSHQGAGHSAHLNVASRCSRKDTCSPGSPVPRCCPRSHQHTQRGSEWAGMGRRGDGPHQS